MPRYEYACKCGEVFYIDRSIHDPDENPVCKCGEQMKRVFFAPPITFKGSGFYSRDKNA